mmetsp:Transcript_133404/g.386156  ORF Transcript_133404/g.386156 Transcript_133404/m.386156 type:complete len:212 (-) Transcript_133404:470-1105(-)
MAPAGKVCKPKLGWQNQKNGSSGANSPGFGGPRNGAALPAWPPRWEKLPTNGVVMAWRELLRLESMGMGILLPCREGAAEGDKFMEPEETHIASPRLEELAPETCRDHSTLGPFSMDERRKARCFKLDKPSGRPALLALSVCWKAAAMEIEGTTTDVRRTTGSSLAAAMGLGRNQHWLFNRSWPAIKPSAARSASASRGSSTLHIMRSMPP